MEKNPANSKLDDIAMLRTIAIIGVVVYHVFWAVYFAPMPIFLSSTIPMSSVYESIFHTWLAARMSLFIFISGYLYSYLFNKRTKYADTSKFVRNKFTRLIVPYFIFTIFMGITLLNLTLSNFLKGYMHLWFILMLFWCFVLIRFVSKIKNSVVFHILIFILFSIAYGFIPMAGGHKTILFGLDLALKFFCWFWLGYIVFLDKEKVKFFFKNSSLLVMFFIWLLCCFYLESFSADDRIGFSIELDGRPVVAISRYLASYFSHLSFVLFVYGSVEKAFRRGIIKNQKWIEEINRCSYGIYIFHLWILLLILLEPKGTRIYSLMQSNAIEYPVIFPLILFLITFSLSFLLTKLFLRLSWGRFMLGAAVRRS